VEINALQSTTVVNCKCINVHMRQLPSIRHSLTTEAMLTLRLLSAVDLITATVCSLLYVVIQNAAARFVTGARRRDHVTPVLRELHWLPVRQRIRFKTAVMVYECIHGLAPLYLASHCKPTSSCPGRYRLRSATSGQLNFPRTKTDYGKQSFAINGPVVWNSLHAALRSPDISLDIFKARLKTFLLNC